MSGRLTRRTWAALAILLLAIPALMAVFVCVWDERKYYLTSLLLVGLMFVPFVLRFEGRRPQARELVLLATMTALAVAGRAAFYWLPQCKPVCAIVILTAVAFTPEAGFVTGAAAGLISNFFFGQGPWTPWQMLGFGLVGFVGGVLFSGRRVRLVPLLIYGFLSVFVLYGVLLDTASMLMYNAAPSWQLWLATCASGVVFNLIHACSTAVFLLAPEQACARERKVRTSGMKKVSASNRMRRLFYLYFMPAARAGGDRQRRPAAGRCPSPTRGRSAPYCRRARTAQNPSRGQSAGTAAAARTRTSAGCGRAR